MSWIKVYIHLVFTTKNREPFLNTPALRKLVFDHIRQNARSKKIWLDCVNGYQDHAHCLISLGKEETISKVAQMIKGESSYWINQQQLTTNKFSWQDDYWAAGVSERHISIIRTYINNQEEHHKNITFTEELDVLINRPH